MEVEPTSLRDVLLLKPAIHPDDRGRFMELYHAEKYPEMGIPEVFVQDNVSTSRKGVVRGLHYQLPNPQGKLVSVLSGSIFDVAVDIRLGSPTFGQWAGEELSSETGFQMWVPAGYAHGFMALEDNTTVVYKCTDVYHRDTSQAIKYDDPDLGILWPDLKPVLSEADLVAPRLAEVDPDLLFSFR